MGDIRAKSMDLYLSLCQEIHDDGLAKDANHAEMMELADAVVAADRQETLRYECDLCKQGEPSPYNIEANIRHAVRRFREKVAAKRPVTT